MLSVAAGALALPALRDAGDQDDDVVACVMWRGGRVLSASAVGYGGDARVRSWIDRESRLIGPLRPLAYCRAGDLWHE